MDEFIVHMANQSSIIQRQKLVDLIVVSDYM
jgi:hypothetical protein